MEMEKNTITAGDQKKASEFEESVKHLYQPLEEWVKEDTRNRSYLLIVSCVESFYLCSFGRTWFSNRSKIKRKKTT